MISSYVIRSQAPEVAQRPAYPALADEREFSRLIGAAVVSRSFCQLLIEDPQAAIRQGYGQENFKFTQEAVVFLVSIRARSLEEFAGQIVRGLQARAAEGHFPVAAGTGIQTTVSVNSLS